jgi:hypothetical protein
MPTVVKDLLKETICQTLAQKRKLSRQPTECGCIDGEGNEIPEKVIVLQLSFEIPHEEGNTEADMRGNVPPSVCREPAVSFEVESTSTKQVDYPVTDRIREPHVSKDAPLPPIILLFQTPQNRHRCVETRPVRLREVWNNVPQIR